MPPPKKKRGLLARNKINKELKRLRRSAQKEEERLRKLEQDGFYKAAADSLKAEQERYSWIESDEAFTSAIQALEIVEEKRNESNMDCVGFVKLQEAEPNSSSVFTWVPNDVNVKQEVLSDEEKKASVKSEEKDVVKKEENVKTAVANASGSKPGKAEKSSGATKKESAKIAAARKNNVLPSTPSQKTAPRKPPSDFKYYEDTKVVSMTYKDSDSETDNDYSTIVKFVEPAGTLYDEKGIHIDSGLDLCDCGDVECEGCWYPCKKCESSKCGLHCRVHRTFMYEEVIIEGYGCIRKNRLYTREVDP